MKNFLHIENLLIIATAISLPIVMTDQYMRFAKFPRDNSRVMLLSGGKLDSSGIGIRHYTPNSTIRHSAVYGDVLEYSYKFKTDENGFRVTYNCNARNKTNNLVAITGDSFTEGQGSNISWIKSVQKRLCDQGQNSVNLAIAGYGVEDMKDSLDYAYEKLGAKKAIIAILPDDIYRRRTPMTSNLVCSMYQPGDCGYRATWWHHPEDFKPNEIVAFAATKYKFGILQSLKVLNFKLKTMIKYNIKHFANSSQTEMISRSISSMNSITEKFGPKNVSLIILPTKNERNLIVSSELDTQRRTDLRTFLESVSKNVSIKDLRECPLNEKHFFPLDGHINEEGHKLLGKCFLNKGENSI